MRSTTQRWFKPLSRRQEPSASLFCFPYSGGSGEIFKAWPEWLPGSVEVYGVQYPGRGSRFVEPLMTNIHRMLDVLEGNIMPYLGRPFAFFGHSLGARLAFELCVRLEGRGVAPTQLFLSGRNPPHAEIRRDFHKLPDAEFRANLARMNGTPAELLANPELMDLVVPIIRADFALSETDLCQAVAPVSCPLIAFGGEDDEDVPPSAIQGWGRYTESTFEWSILPGDHFFLIQSQAALLKAMASHLAVLER